MPSVPIFVLMMMQQLETYGAVENSTGLYGALYELIIRDVIKGSCSNLAEVEVRLNYLSEFAFHLHRSNQRFIEQSDFQIWHISYCDEYNLSLISTKLVAKLQEIGVFRRDTDAVGFKYRYYYCFFLARYLSLHIHDPKIIVEVEKISRILYNVDAANTMLFLCHLSKNPQILELILSIAKGLFAESEKYDMSQVPQILPEGRIYPTALVLPEKSSPAEARKETLRKHDDVSRPNALEQRDDRELITRGDEAIIKLVNDANSAHHVIRICGQIVRNFYGSIRGELQVQIIRESYNLCLRMLNVLYEFIERDKHEIAGTLAQILRHRYPDISVQELDERTRTSMQFFAIHTCYSLVKHTSNSVGLADLRPTFDKILNQKGISISEKVLDISARLDYFSGFPKEKILKIAKILDGRGVGYEALRILAWEHMKLFDVPYGPRQSVCARLDINVKPAMLLNPKQKRFRK